MSEGELLQIEKARKLNITEEIYFDIIKQKTASLIAACCESGAASAGVSEEEQLKMREFGELVGLAFQIKDDLFDYGNGADIGKPTGIDIKERKMTLPLIYALNNAERKDRKKIINIVKNHNTDSKKVGFVLDYVGRSGGIEYTKNKMIELKDRALEVLYQFEENEARHSLEGLVNYTINREK